jgi:hypothetical protein
MKIFEKIFEACQLVKEEFVSKKLKKRDIYNKIDWGEKIIGLY